MTRLDFSRLPPPNPSRIAPYNPYAQGAGTGLPESSQIRVGENGYIHGVDGMLDQIGGALMKHAGPMIVRDVLPAFQQDKQLQVTIGAAMGRSIAEELQPWIVVGVGAISIIAIVQFARWHGSKRR